MTENVPNPVDVFKNVYFGLLDQTAELAKQPIESTKKIVTPAIEAQKEAWNSISKEQSFAPFRDFTSASTSYLEFYSKMLSEGFEVAKKSSETLTDVVLAWEKVALDAQVAGLGAYKNWLNQLKA